jgi:glycosyltransferase involved in cell wall biosynthesis
MAGYMNTKNVVINTLSLLSKLTGIGKYTFEICKRINQLGINVDINYFYGYYSKKLYMMNIPPSGKIVKKAKDYLSRLYLIKKITRESLLLLSKYSNRSFDLYWEPNIVPLEHLQSKYLITTIHDFSFQHYPECLPKENKEYLQKHFWKNIRKSDKIITGSNYVKDEIIGLLQYDAANIKVIYHGVDHDNFKMYDHSSLRKFIAAHKLPDKFILFVGSIEPRKNLKNVLMAYNALPDAFKKECKFVLAGFSGWKNAEIMQIIKREGKNIVYLGYLSNLELAYLYNLASAFIYASLYEGFGIPPLEAMACGTPVIVSRSSSLPEVCGDAAYYVDPLSVDNISDGIFKVFADDALREGLASKGVIRAKSFSWDESARSHIALFNDILYP